MMTVPDPSVDDSLIEIKVDPHDRMAEAGRKILTRDFMQMRHHEDGSRTGEDIEDVHQMRVATRRMRSILRLLDEYYKNKSIRPLVRGLKTLANRLGKIRDLDVMILDLETRHQETAPDADLSHLITRLDARRRKYRKKLNKHLDSKGYQNFIKVFEIFLETPGKGARPIGEETDPHQVRHVLPLMIHDHLARVRAYDTVIPGAEVDTLHALRIEFKRLRYIIQHFSDVLGRSGDDFIDHLKAIQDYLGRLNDVHVAYNRLDALLEGDKLTADETQFLSDYVAYLVSEEETLADGFQTVWEKFNTRTVQSKLSNALLVLR
jgi:CHAD domain-containing protein